jgi:hypothetical protein
MEGVIYLIDIYDIVDNNDDGEGRGAGCDTANTFPVQD